MVQKEPHFGRLQPRRQILDYSESDWHLHTLAYFAMELIMDIKSFIDQGNELSNFELFYLIP
jgi:hypothetical protein